MVAPPVAPPDLATKLATLAGVSDPKVIRLALEAQQCAAAHGDAPMARRLAVIDYSRPSTEQRLWVFDLAQERLLTRAQLDVLWTPHQQTGPMAYGYLSSIGGTPERRWIGHNGGAPGISAVFMHYPEDGLVMIVLANQDHAADGMREWLQAQVEVSLFETSQP